jgi:hypothetical protein
MRRADAIIKKECLDILGLDLLSCLPFAQVSIWQTLCADRNRGGEPAPPIYAEDMTQVLEHIRISSSIDVEELTETESNVKNTSTPVLKAPLRLFQMLYGIGAPFGEREMIGMEARYLALFLVTLNPAIN